MGEEGVRVLGAEAEKAKGPDPRRVRRGEGEGEGRFTTITFLMHKHIAAKPPPSYMCINQASVSISKRNKPKHVNLD